MNQDLTGFIFQLQYLFSNMTRTNIVDVLLVGGLFYGVFQALRLRRAFQVLQGAVVFAILGVALLFLLPFETFGWLLRGLLLASLIGLPVLFQEELRQALAGLGRVGRRSRRPGSAFDHYKTAVMGSVIMMSELRHGALIVLEGETPLSEVIETGIPIHAGSLSRELLMTLFNPKTPLHDGAVVLRGDQLVAASCILPVMTDETGSTHLGTRHRAAMGLSAQEPDALAIVVSEESGKISVAQGGRLYQGLQPEQLEDWLIRFQDQIVGDLRQGWGWLIGGTPRSIIRNLSMAMALSLIAWISVIFQTNPPQLVTLIDVPLRVLPPPADLVMRSQVPATVDIDIQTTEDRVSGITVGALQANLDLSNLPTGLSRVPVRVNMADPRAQVASTTPEFVDVILEPRITLTLTPTIQVRDLGSLPPGYELVQVIPDPTTISVQGPLSLVDRVSEARGVLNLAGRFTSFQQTLNLLLVDQNGESVPGLEASPQTILVSTTIRRTFLTREVPVQASLIADTLAPGYAISRVQVTPPEVTLTGDVSDLAAFGDFISTAPITLTGVIQNLTMDVPLLLPTGVSAVDENGEPLISVVANISVQPVPGYLVQLITPDLRGLSTELTIATVLNPVSVLMIGPQALLDEIKVNLNLVEVWLDLNELEAGSHLIPVQARVPSGVEVELFPAEIRVDLQG